MVQKVVHPFILPILRHFPIENSSSGSRYHMWISERQEGAILERKLQEAAMTEEEAMHILAMVALAVEQAHQ